MLHLVSYFRSLKWGFKYYTLILINKIIILFKAFYCNKYNATDVLLLGIGNCVYY